MESVTFKAMNTQIKLAGEGNHEQLELGFQRSRDYIHEAEKRFTRFSETSELVQLNRSSGSWFHVSPDMLFLLMLINKYQEQTEGLFDPSILPNLEWAGYDRSMDIIRELNNQLPAQDHGRFPKINSITLRINPQDNLVFLPYGMRIDLGGIAKGWIAEHAAFTLADYSTACLVDAGGDMFTVGLPENKKSWLIDVEDPRKPGQSLLSLDVPSGAIATSSIVKRIWMQGDTHRHHLIDPRTGEPANTDWLSVTVLAPHADTAEVFAKSILIAGPQEADSIAQNAPDMSFLAIDRNGSIWGPSKSLEFIHDNRN